MKRLGGRSFNTSMVRSKLTVSSEWLSTISCISRRDVIVEGLESAFSIFRCRESERSDVSKVPLMSRKFTFWAILCGSDLVCPS